MRIISTNVELAWPKLERSFECGLHSKELAPGHKWAEVIHTGLDLPAGIHAGKTLLLIDLHQGEVSERLHSSVCLRKEASAFLVEHECRLKGRECSDILNPACDLPQIEVLDPFGMLTEETRHSLRHIACPIQDDELSMQVENLIDCGSFRERRKSVFQKRRSDV